MASKGNTAEGAKTSSLVWDDGRALPKLCPECTSFFSQLENHCTELTRVHEDPSSTGGLALCGHKANVKAFHASVDHGCTLCGWLWKCFDAVCRQQRLLLEMDILDVKHLSFVWQRLPLQDPERKGEGHYRFALWSLPTDVSKGVALPLPPHRVTIDSVPGSDDQNALLKAVASIGPSTSSRATIDLIRHWIDTCSTKHPVCRRQAPSDQNSPLPGRLLDIANADKIRAVQTSSIVTVKGTPEYAALSHCWGRTNKPQLNRESEHDLKQGVPLFSLPRTFKDSIELARGLGLGFIWIDSLCIVQDSEDDWLEESAKMGGVYRNSTVCISATDAVDHDGGCFFMRECLQDAAKEPTQPPEDAPFRVASGTKDTFNWPFVYNNFVISIDVGLDLTMLRGRVDRAPLNTRAWVFQERMLAPRTIHCTKSQVMWECYEGWSSESHSVSITSTASGQEPWGGYNAKLYCREVDRVRASNKGKWRWEIPASDIIKILRLWSSIIEAYAKKGITFTNDRLVACSAITKATSPILGKFVAGLWEAHLASQLLWYRHRGTEYYGFGWTEDDKMRPRQAPSWSWASLDGEVRLPAYKHGYDSMKLPFGYLVNHPSMIEILKVDVTHRSKDITGAVTGGTIRIRGRVLPLFRHGDETYPFHLQPPKPGDLDYLVIRWDRMESKKQHRADRSVQASEVPQRRVFHDLPIGAFAPLPWSQTPDPSSHVAVPLMMSLGDVNRVTGLVLEHTGAVSGQYQRCGFFHTSPEYWDRLISVPVEVLSSISAEEYSPELGHTISIV